MSEKYIFDSNRDSKNLATEIIDFLKKWGMWKDVQIFTGGKCYSDDSRGGVNIRTDSNPQKYIRDYFNPERLLDMTFEGPLSLLLRHHEYEVCLENVSEEARITISPNQEEALENQEIAELMDEYIDGKADWDPAEFDSYEEWLWLYQYSDMEEFSGEDVGNGTVFEFSSREEYEDFILRNASARESKIREYFKEDLYEEPDYEPVTFYEDDGRITNLILNEFNDLLEKYGLWYELGFSWSLTAYRI